MLNFSIRPTRTNRDLVELILWPEPGVETRIVLTRADLKRFTTSLNTQAEMHVPAGCALLTRTSMTIDHE